MISGDRSFARLFVPDETHSSGDALSPAMRLSEFFSQAFEPRLLARIARDQARPGNLAAYRESLRLFVQTVGDVPLYRLEWSADGEELLDAFSAALSRRKGRLAEAVSPRTVNKHLTALACILAEAGQRSKHHPKAAGLILAVPPVERLREVEREPSPYALDELADVAKSAVKRVRQAAWWRRLCLLAYYTGLRRGALVRFPEGEGSSETVSAKWLRRDQDGLWLSVPSAASKTRAPYSVSVPPWIAASLEAMPKDGPWFEWKHVAWWFQENCKRQGIALHRIRKTTATQLARIDSVIAAMQLGHRGGITQRHYIGREAQAAKVALMPRLDVEW